MGTSQGTIRDVLEYDGANDTTTVVNHLQYSSFGQITSQTDSSYEPRHTYTGREWDADADLYYYRARWYDAAVGRFISEDPIGFAAGDANVSRYVGNKVIDRIDPSGLKDFDPGTGTVVNGDGTTYVDPSFMHKPYPIPHLTSKPPLPSPPIIFPFHGPGIVNYRPTMQAQHGTPPITVLPTLPGNATGGGSGAYITNIPDNHLVGVGGASPCILVLVVNEDSVLTYHFNTGHDAFRTMVRDNYLMEAGDVVIAAGDNSNESNVTLAEVDYFLRLRDDLILDGIADTAAIYTNNAGEYLTYENAVNIFP